VTACMGPVGAQAALAFLALPEVRERLDDGDAERLDREGLPPESVVLGGWDGPDLFGVGVLVPFRDGWSIHFYTRREGRRRWARAFGWAVVEVASRSGPAYVQIPLDLYPDVVNFARRFGFRRVDTEPDAYRKGGRRYDREVMQCPEYSAAVVATTMPHRRPRFRPKLVNAGSMSSEKRYSRPALT